MKYRAVLPERNSNVSHEQPLREFLVLLAGAAALALLVYGLLGLCVDIAVDYISPETELAIYQSAGINRSRTVDDAAPISESETAVRKLLTALLRCVEIGYPVSLRIEESDVLNAYAWPGGHIVLSTGLLDNVESQNGLAFVLSHELAHFKNRDHLRTMGRGVVLVALSVLLTSASSDLSTLMMPVSSLEAAQFSQERESAADATALQIVNCHYSHIGGATELFEVIAAPEENFDFSLTHYFASHPQARERIDAIHRQGKLMGYSVGRTVSKF
jgi:Zn-dependent protease with chaperone function|tara:strand:- start:255 stop:1073 length:819 start_codon:yes stop_codon:yes gene_type:complete